MFYQFKEAYTISIVMIGNFNPSIFQPFWFAHKKLIGDREAQEAKLTPLIHNELVKWETSWMSIEVTKSRFEIKSTQEPYFAIMRDLVISMLQILSEIPITAVGINHLQYFALPDKEQYFQFGNKLVPLSKWDTFMKDPRMFRLEVGEQFRTDGFNGTYKVIVSPSDIELTTSYALLIHILDHFDIEDNYNTRNEELLKMVNQRLLLTFSQFPPVGWFLDNLIRRF